MDSLLLKNFDEIENDFIKRLRQHPVFVNIMSINDELFGKVLMQRRFLSIYFTPMYDISIDILESENAKIIARKIVREEYPGEDGNRLSHRESLFSDIVSLGYNKDAILSTRKTSSTRDVLGDMFDLIYLSRSFNKGDLGILSILRFLFEVLVSEEYFMYKKRIEHMGLCCSETSAPNSIRSKFYGPHILYDSKTSKSILDIGPNQISHSDQLTKLLNELIVDEEALSIVCSLMEKSIKIKCKFYSQFTQYI